MKTKFTEFLRSGGNHEIQLRHHGKTWVAAGSFLSTKSQFPNYSVLREDFAKKLDEIINSNTLMLLRAVGERYDPPLTERHLPDISAVRTDTLAPWEERIEAIWTEWHSHLQRLRPIREAMEQHLLRGFAGLINELRQRGLGISQYVWRSRDDGKVRSAHATHDDRVFSWDNPPEDGHPGQAFNCRCVAEPALPDVNVSPSKDPIAFIASFLRKYSNGISVGLGVRPSESLIDYLLPPEPGVTVNGIMLDVQTQGDLAVAFMNLDDAIKADPQALLRLLASRGGDFAMLARAFGRSAPENFGTAALLAAAGAPEAEVDSALTATRNAVDRMVGGYATALADAANAIRALPDLRWSDVRMVARQIYDDPSVLPQAMVAPFRDRIAVGDYAGALGYGLPEVLAGLAGLARLRGRATDLPEPMPITREMLDAGGRIEGLHNAGPNAPRFDRWIDKGGQVYMTTDGHFAYSKKLDVLGERRQVTVVYRDSSPDFTPFMAHPSGVTSVEIDMTGGSAIDFRRANRAAGHPEWGSKLRRDGLGITLRMAARCS
jgi:hypothetical protein